MSQGPIISEGNTAEVFAWGSSHVLKLYRPGYPPSEAEREANRVQTVISAGVPTPAVIELVTVDGRAGLIFDRVEGLSMLEVLMGGSAESPADFPALLAELHAELHRLPGAELPCLHTRLQARLTEVDTTSEENNDAYVSPSTAAKVHHSLSSLPAGSALCHGDFGPQNVLLTNEGPVIIDWVDATCGLPAADVARSVVLFKYAVLPPTIHMAAREQFETIRQVFVEAYLTQYCELTGVTRDEIDQWIIPVAAARLIHEQSSEEEKRRLADVVQLGLSA